MLEVYKNTMAIRDKHVAGWLAGYVADWLVLGTRYIITPLRSTEQVALLLRKDG